MEYLKAMKRAVTMVAQRALLMVLWMEMTKVVYWEKSSVRWMGWWKAYE